VSLAATSVTVDEKPATNQRLALSSRAGGYEDFIAA
jgi:hypothetical protein